MLLYTDASILMNGQPGAHAGWAMVGLRHGHPPLRYARPFRHQFAIEHSCVAELMAVANALAYVAKHAPFEPGEIVVLHSDSQAAVETINGVGGHAKPGTPGLHPDSVRSRRAVSRAKMLLAYDGVRTLVDRYGIVLQAHWIKGHAKIRADCPHQPHNRWCDRESRKAAKTAGIKRAAAAKRAEQTSRPEAGAKL